MYKQRYYFKIKLTKALKDYTCNSCTKTIKQGSKHYVCKSIGHNHWYTNRKHRFCYIIDKIFNLF